MASKQCMDCRESNIHPLDRHFSCLRCLGPSHDSFNCTFCDQFPEPVRDIRLTLSTESLAEGKWPENWSQQLRKVENTCSQKAKRERAKANQNLNQSQNQGTPQEGDKTANAEYETKNQNQNQTQNENQTGQNQHSQGQASSLPNTIQGFDMQGLATWQAGINDMMGQMAQSLQNVMEKFDSFTKPAPVESTPKRHKKSKSKSNKKSKSKGDSAPPHKKRRKAAETAPNPNTDTGVDPTPDLGGDR